MKALHRRLDRLEALIEPAEETEFAHQLRGRLECGRLRAAGTREREGLPPLEGSSYDCAAKALTIVEILRLGRSQNAMAHQENFEVQNETS